ncbi:hypothetical protein J7E93_33880 [Streptomyces sp. ISL-36]|uniref:hypothetical protein n=1 Tax=Streptomyces sp. ISL-36 TaxID=2819182 RepID=UPI001BEC63BB|nr:hypothetical protein [Streptomyces sp. ISL-36]MBT2444998.1 hypothetical protein [Streptomyces sp. ISL-36]
MCPLSGVCASHDRHEERLRAHHPHATADMLRLEYVSMALNEQTSLYGPAGPLYRRLTEDGRNRAVLEHPPSSAVRRTADPGTAGSAPRRNGGAAGRFRGKP